MGTDGKYGRIAAEKKDIPDDEPVFLFRAQDVLLRDVLLYYHELSEGAGCSEEHLSGIMEAFTRVSEWQNYHIKEIKVPDTKETEL